MRGGPRRTVIYINFHIKVYKVSEFKEPLGRWASLGTQRGPLLLDILGSKLLYRNIHLPCALEHVLLQRGSRIFHEKLVVAQLVQKSPAFYRNQGFITYGS
jgi:hypothetical protein